MAETDSPQVDPAELRARVGETSLRMMAGLVPGHVVQHLQARLYAEPDDYPWQEVVDTILADSVGDEDAVNKGLVAQRNWLLRPAGGGAVPAAASSAGRRRAPSMKVRGKTFVAALLVKGGFFLIYTLAIVLLLVLLRLRWPAIDIYQAFSGLESVFPGSQGGGG